MRPLRGKTTLKTCYSTSTHLTLPALLMNFPSNTVKGPCGVVIQTLLPLFIYEILKFPTSETSLVIYFLLTITEFVPNVHKTQDNGKLKSC